MVHAMVSIRSPQGLHLSQAGSLAEYALKYHSRILMECGDKQVSAKSLLGLLSLGVRQGSELKIICDGTDEEEALEGMVSFISMMNEENT